MYEKLTLTYAFNATTYMFVNGEHAKQNATPLEGVTSIQYASMTVKFLNALTGQLGHTLNASDIGQNLTLSYADTRSSAMQ